MSTANQETLSPSGRGAGNESGPGRSSPPVEGDDAELRRAGGLAQRVANFRQRRASLAENSSLEFEFEPSPGGSPERGVAPSLRSGRAGVKPGSTTRQESTSSSVQRFIFRQPSQDTPGRFAASAPASVSLTQQTLDRTVERRTPPIAFVDATLGASRIEDIQTGEAACAPLGKRFLAGVVDALVLLAAGGIFAALFTLIGGRVQSTPFDLAVIIFVAAFWIFAYFGSYSSITLSTPGQSALGLTVRNLEGEAPTRQEAWLRAFGYLVSIASLMLGFLWAAMDSEGMAWHDHISGTLLTGPERIRMP